MKTIKTTYILILLTLFIYVFSYLGYKEITTKRKPIKQPQRKELKKTKSTCCKKLIISVLKMKINKLLYKCPKCKKEYI